MEAFTDIAKMNAIVAKPNVWHGSLRDINTFPSENIRRLHAAERPRPNYEAPSILIFLEPFDSRMVLERVLSLQKAGGVIRTLLDHARIAGLGGAHTGAARA